ncbi:zinc finger and BTB domain-containing protein 40 isoform X2 [Oryzias melastigma]|uniref:zinc finger and BTB domain-containing protein 40 isoform X2 n=1 Tax=Oryzias melastigma TaxID=30732 RepID=UPI000CF8353D|nr:zinc finger and BTB domain-containing protein 40 isoform X2 [Oryzias melastigma]
MTCRQAEPISVLHRMSPSSKRLKLKNRGPTPTTSTVAMMELPNYSSQLLQQLWALRKEGHLCDCTILVGDTHHHAHKLVLAASSMLFRSLLDGSDTISIDTSVVSSQEFACLLDMLYTGKLPLGKYNVGRIVTAADNLQMFDVAVGFKSVLSTLVNQQNPVPTKPEQTTRLSESSKVQTESSEGSVTPSKDKPAAAVEEKEKEKEEEKKEEKEDKGEEEEQRSCTDDNEGPASKKARVDPVDLTGPDQTSGDAEKDHCTPSETPCKKATEGLLKHASPLKEFLATVPSVQELLSKAAENLLNEKESEVVCCCCQEADPTSAAEKLVSRVKDGGISEGGMLQLLRAVKKKAPSSFPSSLLPLLEGGEISAPASPPEADSGQSDSREEEQPDVKDEDQNKEEEEEEEEEEEAGSTSPSKRFSCRWCKRNFEYKCRMIAHMKRCSMSNQREQQCPQCPEKLANQRALRRHQAEAHPTPTRSRKKVSCDLCGRSFAHPSGMLYHKRTEHFDERPFACDECGAKFGANSSLKNHMRLHTGERPYLCKHCDMSFSVAAALAYHTKKKHSEGKMYVCQYCKAVFAQSIELTRHVRTHTGDRPYVCRECGRGYSQASGLTVHLHTFHNMAEPHDCQKCCLSFPSLEEHQQHLQEFHPKDFHKCTMCDKMFSSPALLEKHRATHVGSKPFSCELCNKSYQQLSGLWYHNRTNHPDVFASHTRQLKTLVQCDVCFKFFPSAASLSRHRTADHQDSETSVMRCLFCKEVLDEQLQEHVCKQHMSQSGDAFSCPLCSLICSSMLELQEHLLSSHMDQESSADQQASTSSVVDSAEGVAKDKKVESKKPSEGQQQVGMGRQVLVALPNGGGAGEVVEVNMYELLDNSVTFVCGEKTSEPDS